MTVMIQGLLTQGAGTCAGLKDFLISGDALKFPKPSLVAACQDEQIDLTNDEDDAREEVGD